MASNLSWIAYHNQLLRDGKRDIAEKMNSNAIGKGYDLIKKEGVCEFGEWYERLKKRLYYDYISSGLDDKYLPDLIAYAWKTTLGDKDESYPIYVWAKLESIRQRERKRNWIFCSIIGVLAIVVIACLFVIRSMPSHKVDEPIQNQVQGLMSNQNEDVDVYICTGETATSYHLYRDCMGLSNCSDYLLIMSKSEAEQRGRHLCGFCKNR